MTFSKNPFDIDESLVKRLLEAQFPQWAHLPIEQVNSSGTDNSVFRLGEDMAVRLPRTDIAIGQVEKEQRWLPKLSSYLPVAVPVPLGHGLPTEDYPWHWSVYNWLKGENAANEPIENSPETATVLAQFITALQKIDPSGGPPPGESNSWRGVPLAMRDSSVRKAIEELKGMIDTDAATSAWESALHTPVWNKPPVWLHGDIHAGNLLVDQGKLSAIIDFGCLGIGDPACDLIVAWNVLTPGTRKVFRSKVSVDDATWIRGSGWALSIGLIALPYYLHTNPVLVNIARRLIHEVLTDFKNGDLK